MPIAIVYPANLPGPRGASLQAIERRSTAPEPFEAETFERDRRKDQQFESLPMTDAEADAFRTWYDEELILGGAWFASSWPMPGALVDAGYTSAVRRWVGMLQWAKDDAGFWIVSGPLEVRGRGMVPVKSTTFFLLHLDGNLDDECPLVFSAPNYVIDGAPNALTFTTSDPRFGTAAAHNPNLNAHIVSAEIGSFSLGAQDFQIEWWIRLNPDLSGAGGPVIDLFAEDDGSGGGSWPDVRGKQLEVSVLNTGETAVHYYDGNTLTDRDIARVGSAILLPNDNATWSHAALCSDAHSIRLYVNGELALEDVGHRPADIPRAGQMLSIMSRYAAGVAPLQQYLSRLGGDLDEMRMLVGEATYSGSTITVPTAPFRK